MKRVNLLFMLCLLLCATTGRSQTFTSLITDAAGDNNNGVADIKALSYRFNTAGDSIYFKIETHDDMLPSDDLGFMFGIDTNLVGSSGQTWNGANTSMRYDHALFLEQNGVMAPGIIYAQLGHVGTAPSVDVSVQMPNSKTLIVGLKLNQLDNNGKFNFLFGSGFFDLQSSGIVYDDAPETTYLEIRKNAAGIAEIAAGNKLALHPNPAADRISWTAGTLPKGTQGRISDMTGKLVASFDMGDGYADIRHLLPGMYMLQAGDATATFVKQ